MKTDPIRATERGLLFAIIMSTMVITSTNMMFVDIRYDTPYEREPARTPAAYHKQSLARFF